MKNSTDLKNVQHALSDYFAEDSVPDKKIEPPVKKKSCDLPPVTQNDLRSELTRLADYLGIAKPEAELNTMRDLYDIREKSEGAVTASYTGNRIFSVAGGRTEGKHYGAAVDIGTVTVAVYLLDLANSRVIDAASEVNLQNVRGADIISRISYAFSNTGGLDELQTIISNQIENIITRLTTRNEIAEESVGVISVSGNTTMLHLLMGVNPKNIALSPFVPVFTSSQLLAPDDIGLGRFRNSRVLVLPGISGFVGADITGGILATGMFRRKEHSILVDLGVNCEIVLGNRDEIISCSSAAGPAFAGVEIFSGTGGIEGAINRVELLDNKLNFATVGEKSPAGICGSGILDISAALLNAGVFNHKGKFRDLESITHPAIRERMSEGPAGSGGSAVKLTGPGVSADGDSIFFTQKDLREVQGAKAAVAGGINTLLAETGLNPEDISNVYISSGFGSSLSEKSAETIGLIPEGFIGKIVSSGNTAGTGAVLAALSEKEWDNTTEIAEKTRYLELSTSNIFLGEFGKQMYFKIPDRE